MKKKTCDLAKLFFEYFFYNVFNYKIFGKSWTGPPPFLILNLFGLNNIARKFYERLLNLEIFTLL